MTRQVSAAKTWPCIYSVCIYIYIYARARVCGMSICICVCVCVFVCVRVCVCVCVENRKTGKQENRKTVLLLTVTWACKWCK